MSIPEVGLVVVSFAYRSAALLGLLIVAVGVGVLVSVADGCRRGP